MLGIAIASVFFIPYLLKEIGGGDVKLLLALGFYLGIGVILLIFIVLFLLALFYILKGVERNLPLAPFILCSYLILGGVVLAKIL